MNPVFDKLKNFQTGIVLNTAKFSYSSLIFAQKNMNLQLFILKYVKLNKRFMLIGMLKTSHSFRILPSLDPWSDFHRFWVKMLVVVWLLAHRTSIWRLCLSQPWIPTTPIIHIQIYILNHYFLAQATRHRLFYDHDTFNSIFILKLKR